MSTSITITQTGNSTWTAPANIDPTKHLVVEAVGSGGNGDPAADLGTGGGGGCYVKGTLAVSAGEVFHASVDGVDGEGSTSFGTSTNNPEIVAPSGLDGGDGGQGGGGFDGNDSSGQPGNQSASASVLSGTMATVAPGGPGGRGASDGMTPNGGGGGAAGGTIFDPENPGSGASGKSFPTNPAPGGTTDTPLCGNGGTGSVTPTNGTNYGGGGGGGGGGTAGTQGVIRLTYSLVATSPPRSSLSLSNSLSL